MEGMFMCEHSLKRNRVKLFPLAFVVSLALSGCASQDPARSDTTTADAEPVMPAQHLVNRTLLDVDFLASEAQETTAELDVPEAPTNGTLLHVWVELDQGAWQSFVLTGLPNACNNVATA